MGFLKRFLPFFAAFVLGLFVASFFVSVGFSRFDGRRYGRHHRHDSDIEQLRRENYELRMQIEQLKRQVPPVEMTIPAGTVPQNR